MNNLLRDQLLTNPKTFLRSIPFMKVSEGIAIGAVTGLGYFSAYLSDVSYKAYFGLPALYASVGLNAIILSIFAFVIMSLVLLAYLQYPIVARYGKWVLPVFLPGPGRWHLCSGCGWILSSIIRWKCFCFSFCCMLLLHMR